MQDIETELISHELGMSYLRPITRTTWKDLATDILVLLAIVAFYSLIYWLGSVHVL